ncbi:MAG: 50S ribosomal protein L20 [Acidobacteria bacterium]|nr:50S ribosomal protein L20 [Acidobacteriota bacterium]
MPRVRRGNRKLIRRKKILQLAKGYRGSRHRLYRTAKETVERSLVYSYRDRRQRKRQFRRLWIVRINAASREQGLSYNQFMSGLKRAGVDLDRKVLAELAVNHPGTFAELAAIAKEA